MTSVQLPISTRFRRRRPRDRVQTFRQAFQATLKDPEFVAEAKRGNFELDPVAGEELEKIVNGLFKADAGTVNRLRELLK